MKEEVARFEQRGLWLLNDGRFFLITGIDPISSIKSTDEKRIVYGKVGAKREDGDEFDINQKVFIKDDRVAGSVAMDPTSSVKISIAKLNAMCAKYIGKIAVEKLRPLGVIPE